MTCSRSRSTWASMRGKVSSQALSYSGVPGSCFGSRRATSVRCSALPPSLMSTPRPAMLVAIVTAPGRPGLGDRLALELGVLGLGVEHRVLDALLLQLLGEHLGDLDRDRADEHRLARLVALLDLARDGCPLAVLRLVDLVVLVLPDHRPVRGDLDHLQLVDLHELGGLGDGRAGHAAELVVAAEVVLVGDRGDGLVLLLDRHALLGLDRLVQALRPAPALKNKTPTKART